MKSETLNPVTSSERIISLDILRGVAVLGILIMNVQSFSMPSAAYINPTAYGDLTALNKWIWIVSHVVASEKFMSIFSLLFGAGVLIFTDKAQVKGKNSAALHYRRMGWLLLFGLAHAYLFWEGDILVAYSLCGMLVYAFRKLRPRVLLWVGFGFFVIPMIIDALASLSISYWPEEAIDNTMRSWNPDESIVQHDLKAMRGSWIAQMKVRMEGALFMQTGLFMMQTFWRVVSMMLLGMALYKWNIVTARRSRKFYVNLTIFGLLVGYVLSGLGVMVNFRNAWVMEYSMFMGAQFNYVGSVAVALGYIGIVMLITQDPGSEKFRTVFAPVGRMAFSNYILQTLICTFIFYGHGLGLYGSVERKFQVVIMAGIWILVMIISTFWLNRFRFGPLEGIWRSLTYWRWQTLYQPASK
jgi:uncharacterized protein